MKNYFYFTLKALFVLNIFIFLSWHSGYGLDKKDRLISEFMTSQPEKQTIAIYILPNISRTKDNQTMKFGQLIEYNMGNTFLKNSYTMYGGETIPSPLLQNKNWAYYWINILKFYTVCYYCMPNWLLTKHIKTKLLTSCFYFIPSFFKKIKRGLTLVSMPHFQYIFRSTIFLFYILLAGQILLSGCLYFVRYRQYVYCNCFLTS